MRIKQKGQSLVEFALIIPILMLLILGIIEGALLIQAYISAQNAAREAARYAISGQPLDDDGNPWNTSDFSEEDRANAIKAVAIDASRGTGFTQVISTTTETDFLNCADQRNIGCAGALGVGIWGETAAIRDFNNQTFNNPGIQGLNIRVDVYHNVLILDPIYAAIVPDGYVHLRTSTVMQNEGVDISLGNVNTPPTPTLDPGNFPPPGEAGNPRVEIQGGSEWPRGANPVFRLVNYPPGQYEVIVKDLAGLGNDISVEIVDVQNEDIPGITNGNWPIPLTTALGSYTVVAEIVATGLPLGNNAVLTVIDTDDPEIIVSVNNNQSPWWPLGTPLDILLTKHTTAPAFDVRLQPPNTTLGNLVVDGEGTSTSSLTYNVPQSLTPGEYIFETDEATRTVEFRAGCIKIDASSCNPSPPVERPNQVFIDVILEDHAPSHNYRIELRDAADAFVDLIADAATTDQFGRVQISDYFLGLLTNGAYKIVSLDNGNLISTANLTMNTPPTPFIVVQGGYTWPAGENIVFELRNHDPNTRYDIYWEGTRVITNVNLATNADGLLALDYTIPLDTETDTYKLSSKLAQVEGGSISDPDFAEALELIEVIGVPYLQIAEGNPQVPGATITVEMFNHNFNEEYDLYIIVDGSGIPFPANPVSTDSQGEGSTEYVIPANIPPGQTYLIQSYPRGNTTDVTAEITLQLVAPDLRIVNIETPNPPVFNMEMPITITVINDSSPPVTITHRSFDVDLYVDPLLTPNLGRALPPGDIKAWLAPPILPGEIRVITTTTTLFGTTPHNLWARVDTSNRIAETNETNNLLSLQVTPLTCQVELETSDLDLEAPFGDANSFNVNRSGDTITLRNNGTSPFEADDANGGYLFAYHSIEGDFDVRVQASSHSSDPAGGSLSPIANFGLEVRASTDTNADKIQWGHSSGSSLIYQQRQTNGTNINGDLNIGPSGMPVWLRIVKAGGQFTLYYSEDSFNPPVNWTEYTTLDAAGLAGNVLLGVYHAPMTTGQNTVVLEDYHVCSNPGGTCGPVREANEMVVINANNFVGSQGVSNLASTGGGNWGPKEWEVTIRDGQAGVVVAQDPGGNPYKQAGYSTGSPRLDYEVDFTSTGRYYVWFLAWKPNNSGDSFHFGPTVSPPPSDDFWGNGTFTAQTFEWFNRRDNGPNYIDIDSIGTTSFSAWMREDGFELYQILLTQDDTLDPSTLPETPQSQCSNVGVPPAPPGLQQCQDFLVNGNFEDDTLMSEWHFAGTDEQVTRTNLPHYLIPGENFSMALPDTRIGGIPRSPWLYQEFTLPTWVMTPTVNGGGGSLNMKLQVGVNPEGAPEPDPLFATLHDLSGGQIVADPITVTTGAATPALVPPTYTNLNWNLREVNLAQAFDPPEDLLSYRGQTLRLRLEAPNTGNDSTIFYVDEIEFEVCNAEPVPVSFSTKVAGEVRVLIDGVPTQKPGVFVWIYAIDGQLQKTYTIQDSTFSFYNLPATSAGTQYIIYAEYTEDNDFFSSSTSILLREGQTIDDIALLLF